MINVELRTNKKYDRMSRLIADRVRDNGND